MAFAYKAGNGVTQSNEKAIELFYSAGLNYLKIGYPMDAKDNVFSINHIDNNHPLKHSLNAAIQDYEKTN
ncbi:MAG: hypothetical protein A6F71_08200 [Cycloclasticus sp. symbiont of Poecilosclerida sp. M]|nr:MAG: hypothetical protein A6F71_08200 [Cycloclasticus sp. symbiont of Poecilosclerida sp. M]